VFEKGKPGNHLVIHNSGAIIERARRWLKSDDINLVLAAVFVLTGFRFAEVLNPSLVSIETKRLTEPLPPDCVDYWGCIANDSFAKKGENLKTEQEPCRNKLFLAPAVQIKHAILRIREAFPCEGLTNGAISDKYAKKVNTVLQEKYADLFPNLVPTSKVFRYFYAAASYALYGEKHHYVKNVWYSIQLGHCMNGPLAYLNMELEDLSVKSALCSETDKLK
jgi:hypothetical protein